MHQHLKKYLSKKQLTLKKGYTYLKNKLYFHGILPNWYKQYDYLEI